MADGPEGRGRRDWPRRGWPSGLLGMLALVVATERWVARHPLEFSTAEQYSFRATAAAAQKEAKRADVLFFGDSLVKLGVVPRAVEERCGRKVYNLSVGGCQAPETAALFRQALAAGARPEAVVVDFFPALMGLTHRHTADCYSLVMDEFGAAELAWWAGDVSIFGEVVAARWLPSLRGRSSIRAQVTAAVAGKTDPRKWANTMYRRNWRSNKGAQLEHTKPELAGLSQERAEAWRAQYFPKFTCRPVHARAVESFLDAAAAAKVPVFWLLPPYTPRVEAKVEASGFEEAHRAFVRSYQERYPNVRVLDARHAVAADDVWMDPHHLGPEGAYGFSLALGDALRHALPGRGAAVPAEAPRWVKVPSARRAPLPQGIEDMAATHEAIVRGPAPARH